MRKLAGDHKSVMDVALDAAQLRHISRNFPGHWLQGYVRGKLRSDPVYAAAAGQISTYPGPVLDVGCGIGLFAHYLHAIGRDGGYLGIDSDANKIRIARHSAPGNYGVCFDQVSCERLPDWCGHVVILDTLHYLAAAVQQQLLRAAVARVASGTALIIRSVVRDSSLRFGVTRFEEFLMHGIRWMRRPVLHYPDIDELCAPLADAGLTVEIKSLWGRTPFNSYLVVARRGPP